MSDRLPRISGKKMQQLVEDAGFIGRAAKGSHTFYRDANGRKRVVAAHGAQDLSVTMIAKILRDRGVPRASERPVIPSLNRSKETTILERAWRRRSGITRSLSSTSSALATLIASFICVAVASRFT